MTGESIFRGVIGDYDTGIYKMYRKNFSELIEDESLVHNTTQEPATSCDGPRRGNRKKNSIAATLQR